MTSNFYQVESPEQFKELLSKDLKRVSCLNFWADWAEPCAKFSQEVEAAAPNHPNILFLSIEAENLPDISESFDIDAVPTFLLLRGHTLLARHSGGDANLLKSLLTQHSGPSIAPTIPTAVPENKPATAPAAPQRPRTEEEITARCHELMNKHKVVLFMKGNPSSPKCGFSRQTVGLLREKGVEFAWFDIFSDEDVRQGLKKVNDWPTFPQVIVNGELVGGLDIVREMMENGEWDEVVADGEDEKDEMDDKA